METLISERIQPDTYTFKEVLHLRKSCRGFLRTPVPGDLITSVLEDAQMAPSNCNTQPWPLEGGAFGLAVELAVNISDVSIEEARRLTERAHQVCPYSNATRNNIEVSLVTTNS